MPYSLRRNQRRLHPWQIAEQQAASERVSNQVVRKAQQEPQAGQGVVGALKRGVKRATNRVSEAAGNALNKANKITAPVANLMTTEGKLMPGFKHEHHMLSNYAGPNTQLHARLKRGDKGVTDVDAQAKYHDIAYDSARHAVEKKEMTQEEADVMLRKDDLALIEAAENSKRRTPLEKLHADLIGTAIRAKVAADTVTGRVSFSGGVTNDTQEGAGKKKTGMDLLREEAEKMRKMQQNVDKELKGGRLPPQKEDRTMRLRAIANGEVQ